jgi:hypothetical protein
MVTSRSLVHRQNVARADTLRFFWVLAPLDAHSTSRVNEPQRNVTNADVQRSPSVVRCHLAQRIDDVDSWSLVRLMVQREGGTSS